MCSSSTLFLSPSVETANICCCLLLFHLIPFQPAISHFLLCCPRTGLQKYLLEWGIFTDQGEALSTLVQSPPRVTEVLWRIIHPETWESYHIISMDHLSWSDKGLLADPHFGLAATDLCYNPTESHLFPVCNLSQNNIYEEHNLAVGFQLSVSCLCNTFPAFRLPLHLAKWVLLCKPCIHWKLGWTYNLTAKGSLSSLPGHWVASKVRCESGGKAPSTLGIFAGQLFNFCWRKRSMLPLIYTVATVYCSGSAQKMLPVSHGNLELAWNKLWANPAVLIHALCDLPLTPAAKPTARNNSGARGLWLMHVFISTVVILLFPVPNSWLCVLISCINL